ncbi:hypothetical protein PGTUg99_033695 [Puccinia graminis f. sp. tritici]|uniref:Uncharacterized protein n=1 Tax=Puccinia graminis f. sp. tritici TaxID=56615 RepID=A0A5B0SCT6_PUCGR|nr:hypothetical protein PGTUg99_033695 [Puccinia graminis f. sp. tritici]
MVVHGWTHDGSQLVPVSANPEQMPCKYLINSWVVHGRKKTFCLLRTITVLPSTPTAVMAEPVVLSHFDAWS